VHPVVAGAFEAAGGVPPPVQRHFTQSGLRQRQERPGKITTGGLYYKSFTIVIYNCNDSCQYYKTVITFVINDHS
jgi:hypothetical protein